MAGTGFRSRLPRWPVTLTVVGLVAIGGAAGIAKWPHAWWWLIVVMVVVAAAVPPALAPDELVDIGYMAEVTHHYTEVAIQAFRHAAGSGHADAVPLAAGNLGILLARQGDIDGAKAAFQQAIDSGRRPGWR